MSAVEEITKIIIEEIEAQVETDLYSKHRDEPGAVLVDGNLNVTALAERLAPPSGHTRFYPEGGGHKDIPNHLIEAFLKGGAE